MTSILLNNKNYEIKDTLLVKEARQVMETLTIAKDFSTRLSLAKPEDMEKLNDEIQNLTVSQWTFVYNLVKRCYEILPEKLDELHNVDLLFLFSEVYKESTTVKKKSEILLGSDSNSLTTQT